MNKILKFDGVSAILQGQKIKYFIKYENSLIQLCEKVIDWLRKCTSFANKEVVPTAMQLKKKVAH